MIKSQGEKAVGEHAGLPKDFSLITHNVSGLHNIDKIRALFSHTMYYKYDVITLTETHLNRVTELLLTDIFENFFWVCTLNRKTKKRGSGGVAILIRRSLLQESPTFSHDSKTEGLLWASFKIRKENFNIGVMYLVPVASKWAHQNKHIIEQATIDIEAHKKTGITLLLGDWNGRIGNLSSIVHGHLFPRVNIDKVTNPQGRLIVNTMNSQNMLILSGLKINTFQYSNTEPTAIDNNINYTPINCNSEFTYACKNGNSNIDRICIDARNASKVKSYFVNNNNWDFLTTKHYITGIQITLDPHPPHHLRTQHQLRKKTRIPQGKKKRRN